MQILNAVSYQYAANNVCSLEDLGGEEIAKLNYGMPKVCDDYETTIIRDFYNLLGPCRS
jgi:hypothetical protein